MPADIFLGAASDETEDTKFGFPDATTTSFALSSTPPPTSTAPSMAPGPTIPESRHCGRISTEEESKTRNQASSKLRVSARAYGLALAPTRGRASFPN